MRQNESYLGEEYKCIASRSFARTDSYKNYEITFKIAKDKPHIEQMKKIMKHYEKENIILATDDDREQALRLFH